MWEKPITGVSVKADKSELKVGETAKLTAVITPEDTTDSKDLKYESSDKAVAEVSDAGVVTAKGSRKSSDYRKQCGKTGCESNG